MDFVGLPALEVLLLTVFFLALFVEVKTGGLGIGFALGLISAGVFFGSQYMKGLVNLYQIGVFLAGVIFISVEILMPTVGIFALIGAAAMLYSVVLSLGGDINALYAMLFSFFLAAVIFALIVKHLPSSKLWHKLVLRDQSTTERGYVSTARRPEILGKIGTVTTKLRPAGTVSLDGKPLDVVSEGGYIDPGAQVEIVAVEGSRVVVRLVKIE